MMDAGMIGGIVGGAIGLAGGAIGTYFSIRNTNGPRERAFMIKASLIAWIAVTAFLAGLLLLPKPYNWFMWLPYGIALPLGIRWCNQRQQEIRTEEAAEKPR